MNDDLCDVLCASLIFRNECSVCLVNLGVYTGACTCTCIGAWLVFFSSKAFPMACSSKDSTSMVACFILFLSWGAEGCWVAGCETIDFWNICCENYEPAMDYLNDCLIWKLSRRSIDKNEWVTWVIYSLIGCIWQKKMAIIWSILFALIGMLIKMMTICDLLLTCSKEFVHLIPGLRLDELLGVIVVVWLYSSHWLSLHQVLTL